MAATHLLLCCILCLVTPVDAQHRHHVAEEGSSVTVFCAPHGEWSTRVWRRQVTLLSPYSSIYHQDSVTGLSAAGARPDMSLNLTDFSLTIHRLQLEDTVHLSCSVSTGRLYWLASTEIVVYNKLMEVTNNTSVTLQCPVAAAGFTTRQWYTRPYSSHNLLYNQTTSGVTKGPAARNDMILDTRTFNLTIGNVRQYDYIFTCSVRLQQTTNVGIIFTAIHSVVVEAEEKASVTLLCDEVRRQTNQSTGIYTRTWQRVNGDVLYHQYRWDGVFYERPAAARVDMSLNNDTFALTIGRARMDDGTMFVCTFGSYIESVKVIIYNQNGLSDTSEVSPPVTDVVSPAIIGGAAAAAVVLIIVIVIVIAVCVRKKAQPKQVTDQTIRASESRHRPKLDVPDVAICDETYLPQADDNQYEEIAAQGDAMTGKVPICQGTCIHPLGEVLPVLPPDNQSEGQRYEKLRPKANTPIDKWFKDRDIPKATAKKLERQDIMTLQHLENMSRADMVEAGLSVGERTRITSALKSRSTSRF